MKTATVTTSAQSSGNDSAESTPETPRVQLHLPISTILKVLVTIACVWAILKLIPGLILLVLSIILAITLWPVVERLERRGMPRGYAVAAVGAGLVTVLSLFVVLVLPPLLDQTLEGLANADAYRKNVQAHLGPEHPILARLMGEVFDLPSSPEVAQTLKRPLVWGQLALRLLLGGLLVVVLALYLLMDGKRTYAWLLAYVPRRQRSKMAETVPAVSEVVQAYVQGQLLTSLLFGSFAFIVLTFLHVPSALPLAVLAAICDVLPLLGIFVSGIPAALFALSVSPVTAAAVAAFYLLYHAFENYAIVPHVYGKRLRLSSLVILIALILGGSLYGIVGAILVLPLIAAYSIIEKIWLHEYLSDELVADHIELEKAAAEEPGGDRSDRAVEAVLQGAKHAAERAGDRESNRA